MQMGEGCMEAYIEISNFLTIYSNIEQLNSDV